MEFDNRVEEITRGLLVEAVYEYNAFDKNAVCCIEEMSELTKVLTKALRNSPKFKKEDLIEELGHVMLMCNVMARAYEIEEDEILKIQKTAVDKMYEDK